MKKIVLTLLFLTSLTLFSQTFQKECGATLFANTLTFVEDDITMLVDIKIDVNKDCDKILKITYNKESVTESFLIQNMKLGSASNIPYVRVYTINSKKDEVIFDIFYKKTEMKVVYYKKDFTSIFSYNKN